MVRARCLFLEVCVRERESVCEIEWLLWLASLYALRFISPLNLNTSKFSTLTIGPLGSVCLTWTLNGHMAE